MGFRIRSRLLFFAVALVVVLSLSAGQASANHVHCGDTITQDTTLDSPLNTCHEGSAIVIGADDITLDLNGFEVGAGGGFFNDPIGIDNRAGHDGVTIKNGRVVAAAGVVLRDASRNQLSNVRTSVQESGISLYRSDHNVIDDSGGFAFDGGGISLVESNHNLIRGGFGSSARTAGIGLFDSNNNRIEGSSGGGLVWGINAFRSNANRIEDGRWFGGFAGITLRDSNSNRLTGNSGRSSGEGRGGPLGSGAGIWLDGSSGNRVVKSLTNSNAFDGIHLVGSIDNVIARSVASENGKDGVFVDAASAGTVTRGNVVTKNADDGLDVESSSALLIANIADHNADLGIEAVEGVTDGGGNKAFGNGNPLQCLNVVCR